MMKHWRAVLENQSNAGTIKTEHMGRWNFRSPKQNEKRNKCLLARLPRSSNLRTLGVSRPLSTSMNLLKF